MKAKRLRALLVAGLLSLAPAVTLTSCGGGGGGGGGDAGSSLDDSLNNDDGTETLSDIVGKTLIVEFHAGTQQITFGENGTATGRFARKNGETLEYRGRYGISSYSNAAIAEAVFTSPAENWKLYYSVQNGKLEPSYVILSANGKSERVSNCRFQ